MSEDESAILHRGAAIGRTTVQWGALLLLIALILGATGTAFAEDDEGGSTISVQITDEPTPTPVVPSPQPDQANVGVGGSSLFIGGVSVAVGRTIASDGVGLVFTRGSFRVEISGRNAQGVALQVDAEGNLIVDSGGSLVVRGSGFRASTPVAVYLFSTPAELGQLNTDSSGSFSGTFAVPPGTTAGVHNVQVVGTVDPGVSAVLTAGLRIYPAPGSPAVVTAPVTPGRTIPSGSTTVQQTPVSDAGSDGLDEEPGTLNLGVFSMSALHAVVEPSLSLTGGAVNLSFTVRNNSTAPFDASARFWLTSLFGPPIASVDGVQIAGLQPGEARRVTARFENVGNWVFYRGFVTFTPPEVVDNTELVPITRETDVFVPPPAALPVVGVLALGAIGLLIWMAVTGRLWFLVAGRRDDEEDEEDDTSAGGQPEPELVSGGVSA